MTELIVSNGSRESRRGTWLRRLAWVLAGVVAIPAVAVGLLYAFGIPILAASFIVGSVLYAWPRTHHWATLVVVIVAVAAMIFNVGDSLRADGDPVPADFGLGVAFGASAICAVACAEKLGRMVGSAWQKRILT